MALARRARRRLAALLRGLYAERALEVLARIERLAEAHARGRPPRRAPWSERDAVLIVYGDQVRQAGRTPLRALRDFLERHDLDELVSTVHVLPFFPSTSDDGFAVADYRRVDPLLGTWRDVTALDRRFDLMLDLVLNHCSRSHRWFRRYVEGRPPYSRYFLETDPGLDLAGVVRPRSTPLVTPVATSRGLRHLWTTFSDDQIDLDFANPEVLLEMVGVLLFYIARGARILRLDAVAYLWKRPGTPCTHLPETHLVVKVLRALVDAVAPGTLLLTETNVPEAENLSYFGAGDEAHLVYQFALPPLLLDAFLGGDAGALVAWLVGQEAAGPLPPGTTFLNFAASHDGIGVLPLEGLLPRGRLERLVDEVRARGGLVSHRRGPDGIETPYELNIAWFSALADAHRPPSGLHVRRYLASQALMLALRGIPAVYFQSLLGIPNDRAGLARTGRARSINRRKFRAGELAALLARPGAPQGRVWAGYRRLLAVRRAQPGFHPDAEQHAVDAGHAAVVAFLRRSERPAQRILVAANVSREAAVARLEGAGGERWRGAVDLLGGTPRWSGRGVALEPGEVLWLEKR